MNRKSFLKTSTASAMGYTGMAMGGLNFDPKDSYSRPTDLKITDIRGAKIATIYDWSIIKIYTNQDIVGLGEVRDAGWLSQGLMMKPYLVGKDPFDIHEILRSISHLSGDGRYGGGYSAVDIALMDIIGKALGVPCWKLLGDKVRDTVDVYADTPTVEDPDNLPAMEKRRKEMGFKHYKIDLTPALIEDVEGAMKGGVPTQKGLAIWGEQVLKARESIGYEVPLGADHFGYMTVESGIALGNFMSESKYSLSYIEDVIQYTRFNAVNLNKKITAESRTSTINGEDIFGLQGFKPWIETNAIDEVHPDLLTSGGMIETKKIADYAYQFGIHTRLHNASSPVGIMGNVHLAATLPEFSALEYHDAEMPWTSDTVTGIQNPIIQDGVIPVPDKPGLGIELNEDVLEKHLRDPQYLPYDAGLFAPTPEFDEPMTMMEAKEKGLIGDYFQTGGPWWHYNDAGKYANQTGDV